MIYSSKIGDLNLETLTRLYPAVIVNAEGEVAEMSLEWADLYGSKVEILKYILVFDYTPLNAEVKDRKVLEYDRREELVDVMSDVANYFN